MSTILLRYSHKSKTFSFFFTLCVTRQYYTSTFQSRPVVFGNTYGIKRQNFTMRGVSPGCHMHTHLNCNQLISNSVRRVIPYANHSNCCNFQKNQTFPTLHISTLALCLRFTCSVLVHFINLVEMTHNPVHTITDSRKARVPEEAEHGQPDSSS